jgi:hypothetical protein
MRPADDAGALDALLLRERMVLRAALASLGWPDRVTTTTALWRIGVASPAITSVLVSAESMDSGATIWQVTISGAGFQPGAVLLVDSQPRGTVVSVSDGALVASVRDGPVRDTATIGVGNPDGTAAYTTHVLYAGAVVTPQPRASPALQATPTPTPEATEAADGSGSDNSHSRPAKISATGINPPAHGHRHVR